MPTSSASTCARRCRACAGRAREAGVLVVFVNDNYGAWNAGRVELTERVREGEWFADLVEPLLPDEDAAFVVKARHSIFYETPLSHLLRSEGVEEIALAGQVTEQSILYSALDAHVRDVAVTVVTDAVASIDPGPRPGRPDDDGAQHARGAGGARGALGRRGGGLRGRTSRECRGRGPAGSPVSP